MWIEVISNTTFKLLNSCGFTKLDILKLSYQNIPFQTPDCKVYLVSWASLTAGFKDYSKEMMLLLNGQAMFHDEVSNPESDIQSHLSHALGLPDLDQQQRSQSCFSNREHFYWELLAMWKEPFIKQFLYSVHFFWFLGKLYTLCIVLALEFTYFRNHWYFLNCLWTKIEELIRELIIFCANLVWWSNLYSSIPSSNEDIFCALALLTLPTIISSKKLFF